MRYWFAFVLLILSTNRVVPQDIAQFDPISTDNAAMLEEVGILGRGSANTLDWHPDGKLLAVGSSTGVWLLDEVLEIVAETPVRQSITDLAWSPDGSRIALVSSEKGRCTVQIWDADFVVQELSLAKCGIEVRWKASGDHLAVFDFNTLGRTSNQVLLIDVMTKEILILPGQDGAWSPTGDILFTQLRPTFTYFDTPTIYAWDSTSGDRLFSLDISDIESSYVFWGIDDQTLAIHCTSYDEDSDRVSLGICSLDVRSGESRLLTEVSDFFLGECICIYTFGWNDDITLLAYVYDRLTPGFLSSTIVINATTDESDYVGRGEVFDWKPASNQITTILGNGELSTYDAQTAEVTASSELFTAPISMIAIRPGTDQIASASFGYEQDTRIWEFRHSWLDPLLSFYIEPGEIADYTPDGKELIAGGTVGTDIVINQNVIALDADTAKYTRDIEGFYDQGDSPPRRFWNADYTEYAEVVKDGSILLPNAVSIQTSNVLEDVSWCPNGSTIATVERVPDDYSFDIRTWDATTGENINSYTSGMFAYRGLVWSPDSSKIAVLLEHPTGSNVYIRGLRVFSVIPGERYEFDRHDYQVFLDVNTYQYLLQAKAAWNSDSTMLAVAVMDQLQIHDLQSEGEPLVTLPAYEVTDLEWSSDNRFIAGGSEDGTIRLWAVPLEG